MLAPASDPISATPMVAIKEVLVSFDGFKALNISAFSVDRNELRRIVLAPDRSSLYSKGDYGAGDRRV